MRTYKLKDFIDGKNLDIFVSEDMADQILSDCALHQRVFAEKYQPVLDEYDRARQKILDEFGSSEKIKPSKAMDSKSLDEEVAQIIGANIQKEFLDDNPNHKRLIDIWAKRMKKNRLGALYAHGGQKYGDWVYFDEDKEYQVQKWIDEKDGKYSSLLVCVCNPEHAEISSKKSAVFAPNGILFRKDKKYTIEPFVPEIGYLDSYSIESELVELEDGKNHSEKQKELDLKAMRKHLQNRLEELEAEIKKRREE